MDFTNDYGLGDKLQRRIVSFQEVPAIVERRRIFLVPNLWMKPLITVIIRFV